jgi:flagellin-like protein
MQYNPSIRASRLRSAGRTFGRRWRSRGKARRGVSEVVATIILLAMTVVLFSSIFAWVTSFPTPAPQNVTQFSANFVVTSNGSYVQSIQITHLAGPSVGGGTLIYLKSAYYPKAPEFATPYTASGYLPNPLVWSLGQTLTLPFSTSPFQLPKLPDNITILLVSNDQLIYSTILPGTPILVPPTFVATGITPANPVVGGSFTVTAVVTGNTGGNAVWVTLSNVPGLSGPYPIAQKMTFSAPTNRWTFTVPAGDTTSNGTFYAFVNITNNVGQAATAGVAVTLVSSGGSSSSAQLSVAVVMTPQPPTLPTTSSYFAAVVTYLGSGSNLALTVEFWANQTPGSFGMAHPWATVSQAFSPAAVTITGPSTETVYSANPATYSAWVFNSSVTITAGASVATVGNAKGTTVFATPNDAQGIVVTTAGSSTSHSCATSGGSNLCPFLNATVWNNWTTAFTFQGTIWVNLSGVNKNIYTVTNTTVNPSSFTQVSGPGTHTRWKPASAGTYLVTAIFKVWSGGVVVGYIYDTDSVRFT